MKKQIPSNNLDICSGANKPLAGGSNNESGTHIDGGACGLVYDAVTFQATGAGCGYHFAEPDEGCPDDDDDDDDEV
jgi:hypothetical protein